MRYQKIIRRRQRALIEIERDIEIEEARVLGIRATIARGSLSLSRKDGAIPEDKIVQDRVGCDRH